MINGTITQVFSNRFTLKVATTLACVVVADFLFYSHSVGWTIGLFGLIMLGAITLHNWTRFKNVTSITLIVLIFGQCLLMMERLSSLSLVLIVSGLLFLAISGQRTIGSAKMAVFSYLKNICLFINIPTSVILIRTQRKAATPFGSIFRGWLMPASLSVIFILLITQANPIISNFFSEINFVRLIELIDPVRWIFWMVVGVPLFLLIRLRLRPPTKPKSETTGNFNLLFTQTAIFRSLVAFNVIFAVQTVTDILYLWGGTALPDGITYAEYAHKGAYPLIATALLAGLFVILAYRAGDNSKITKQLIYAWIVQNIFLVFSSIFRTLLYVEHYSLTYLRVAALIWMGLVAIGLILIVIRMMMKKSEPWLVNSVFVALFTVLYAASFPNYASVIAIYNYEHSREINRRGQPLDINYMRKIATEGEAVQVFYEISQNKRFNSEKRKFALDGARLRMSILKKDLSDWRSWTYQKQRQYDRLKKTDIPDELTRVDKIGGWEYVH